MQINQMEDVMLQGMRPNVPRDVVSVIFCPSCSGGRRPQSAAAAACPPSINAENPHKNVRLQKHSPTYGRLALSLCTLCRFRWNQIGRAHV